jgi:hypothetical protein
VSEHEPNQNTTAKSFMSSMQASQKFQETASVEDYPSNFKESNIASENAPRIEIIYTFMFLKGPQVLHKNFKWNDNLSSAIERAKKHCQIMRVRFLFCSPMIADLTLDESRMNDIL